MVETDDVRVASAPVDASRPDADAPRRLRIDSRRRWFPDLGAFMRSSQLLFLLGRRNLTVRYRQTVLGTVWIVAGPLFSAGLFSFVFGRVAGLSSNGVPYFAFSYAGLLSWNLFSDTLTGSTSSLTSNSGLITKIYFSRLVLPAAALAPTVINTAVSLGVMFVILAVYGIGVSLHMLLLPVWLLLSVALAMGLGLALGSIAVHYRDINYVTQVMVPLLLYVTPVAYSSSEVPHSLRTVYLLNPVATIVEGCRWSALGRGHLEAWAVVYAVVATAAVLLGGLAVFARLEWSFADVV